MSGIQWLADCVWTTKPDRYGFAGLLVGLLIAGVLAFRTKIERVSSRYLNGKLIGGGLAIVFLPIGLLLGEIVRVFWTRVCELP